MRARRMMRARRLSGERGVAAVEFAAVVSALMVVAFVGLPVFQLMLVNVDAGRAAGEGVRFATKAMASPCDAADSACVFEPDPACGDLRRRPSAADVQRYVRQSMDDPSVTVTVHDPADPTVTHDPCAEISGTPTGVTVTQEHDLGAFAGLANAASSLVGNEPMFPEKTVTVSTTAVGTQE